LDLSIDDENVTGIPVWSDLLDQILHQACADGKLVVRETVVDDVRRISQRGSPAWCLSGNQEPLAKMRVDPSEGVARRITRFLRDTEAREWGGCARLLGRSGGAVLKTWVPGVPLHSVDEASRGELILHISRRLAELHGRTGVTCAVVCGADDYNTVVMPDGQVAFVDLEATTVGPRWLDVAWSEALLCRSEEEREELWRGYLEATTLRRPNALNWQRARKRYLLWYRTQLQRGAARHPADITILQDLAEVENQLTLVHGS